MLIFAWIVLSVKTTQRNLHNNRGEHHCTHLRGHWLLFTICEHRRLTCVLLLPALFIVWLTKNKVILYGNQEARIFERTRRSIQIDNTKGAPPASRIGRKVRQFDTIKYFETMWFDTIKYLETNSVIWHNQILGNSVIWHNQILGNSVVWQGWAPRSFAFWTHRSFAFF